MEFTFKGKKINLGIFIIPVIFFLVTGVVFNLYSIDLSSLALALILFIYAKFIRRIEKLPSSLDLLLLASIAVLVAFLTNFFLQDSSYANYSGYCVSAIGFVMLVTLLFNNLELSMLYAIFISFLAGSIEGGNYSVTIALLCSSFLTAIFSYRLRRRSRAIWAGFSGGVVQFLIAFISENPQGIFTASSANFTLFYVCFLTGVISAIVVIGVLPIFEFIFKVVTNISLLELSDFNHPLLRRMILEAPGTYQHSLVVANLAESAAEAIDANSLLARVGAYYHDIGKLLKPHYFVENQIPYRDVHKGLKPSMSKLIIVNHVKEGVELAKKFRLNPRIVDFIQQHHGRSLVYYFYQRALQLQPEKEKEYQEEYRYPGPRPQSKEIAIVSLADTVEALSRTLSEPSPSRIEEMVREVVRKKFMEGELDESNLTLRDLEKITQNFIRVLNAIFHTRIDYPKDESAGKRPPKDKEDKS